MGCKSAAKFKLKEQAILSVSFTYKRGIESLVERKVIHEQSEKRDSTNGECDLDSEEEEEGNVVTQIILSGRTFPLRENSGTSDSVNSNITR